MEDKTPRAKALEAVRQELLRNSKIIRDRLDQWPMEDTHLREYARLEGTDSGYQHAISIIDFLLNFNNPEAT